MRHSRVSLRDSPFSPLAGRNGWLAFLMRRVYPLFRTMTVFIVHRSRILTTQTPARSRFAINEISSLNDFFRSAITKHPRAVFSGLRVYKRQKFQDNPSPKPIAYFHCFFFRLNGPPHRGHFHGLSIRGIHLCPHRTHVKFGKTISFGCSLVALWVCMMGTYIPTTWVLSRKKWPIVLTPAFCQF